MAQKQLTNEQVGSLCAALGHLIGSGIGTGDALLLLSQDEPDKAVAALLEEGSRQADAGAPLSRILKASGLFPSYVSVLLTSGEAVGQAEKTLLTLAPYYAARARLQRQLKATLTYPAVLFAVLAAVTAILMIWVLPIFQEVYISLGTGLTGFAGVLLAAGQALKGLLPLLAGLVVLCLTALAIPPIRKGAAAFLKNRIGDRGIFAGVNSARYLQALSLGISCGMTDGEAAALASALADDPGFSRRCSACLSQLEGGDPLPGVLLTHGFLSRSQSRLLEAGIRSGRRDSVLEELAEDSLLRSEEALAAAAGKIEPALVIVACVMLGSILLSVMLPLLNIMTALGG